MIKSGIGGMIDCIINNIGWIKDCFWIVLTITATIIGIKTYVNAKKTIFQPLNTEVIKQQTILFIEIYNLISGNISTKTCYNENFLLDVCFSLKELGYDVSISDELKENSNYFDDDYDQQNCLRHVVGIEEGNNSLSEAPICDSSFYLDEPGRIYDFCYPEIEVGKPVEIIFFEKTKSSIKFFEELSSYLNNPFLPKKLKDYLETLCNEIIKNETEIIKIVLDEVINEIWLNDVKDIDEIDRLVCHGVNEYFDALVNHKKTQQNIISYIKEYLRVDNLFE